VELRQIRVNTRLSQKKLAFDAGIDRSYVGGLERQEENPTVDLLTAWRKRYRAARERPAGPILYPAPELPDDTPIENVRFSTRIRNAEPQRDGKPSAKFARLRMQRCWACRILDRSRSTLSSRGCRCVSQKSHQAAAQGSDTIRMTQTQRFTKSRVT